MSLLEEVTKDAVPVISLLEKLKGHHQSYIQQLKDAEDTVQKLTGAVIAIANLISQHELEQTVNQPIPSGEPNATKEGEQPEGDLAEHQDGESSGQATESSGGNSIEQGAAEQEGEINHDGQMD